METRRVPQFENLYLNVGALSMIVRNHGICRMNYTIWQSRPSAQYPDRKAILNVRISTADRTDYCEKPSPDPHTFGSTISMLPSINAGRRSGAGFYMKTPRPSSRAKSPGKIVPFPIG